MANPVTWFEIIGKDSAGLQKFYKDVFGWKLTPPVKEMGNYSMLQDHEPGMGGGIGEGDARVSVYVETADPQALVDKASRAGARVLMPVTAITPTTTIAMLLDPAGNTFGVMKATAQQQPNTTNGTPRRTARPRAKSTSQRATTAKKTTRRASTARKSTRSTGRRKRR